MFANLKFYGQEICHIMDAVIVYEIDMPAKNDVQIKENTKVDGLSFKANYIKQLKLRQQARRTFNPAGYLSQKTPKKKDPVFNLRLSPAPYVPS